MSTTTTNTTETILPTDGGWVSFALPNPTKSMRLADTRPYFAPSCVSTLIGPSSGMIQLPPHLYWGPQRWFNLLHRSSLMHAYQMILEEGTVRDQQTYLNKEVLLSLWSSLYLPPRLRTLWENKVEGLCHAQHKS